MSYIITFSGSKFDPDEEMFSSISIVDVVSGLSYQFRFSGHRRPLMTLAQHSLIVCELVERHKHMEANLDTRLYALLHDAAEAFLGDVPGPLKSRLPDYQDFEEEIMEKVVDLVGIDMGQVDTNLVHAMDKLALQLEENEYYYHAAFGGKYKNGTYGYESVPHKIEVMKLPVEADVDEASVYASLSEVFVGFEFLSPEESERLFTRKFLQLYFERNGDE